MIFDEFDEDLSGTISMEELREMAHHLGFMPTRVMLEEAVQVVAGCRRPLSFEELVQVLMLYRLREGFAHAEVEELREVHREYVPGDTSWEEAGGGSTCILRLEKRSLRSYFMRFPFGK